MKPGRPVGPSEAAGAPTPVLAAALALSSFATLGFEILLTRVFGIALGYHFAAMVVSIAMLGIAASGVALAALERARGPLAPPGPGLFVLLSAAVAAAHLVAIRVRFDPARLSFDPWHLAHLGAACAVLAVPFLLAGTILASALAARGGRAGALYGADLAGAAAGSLAAVLLQYRLAPGQAVLLFAAVPLGGAVLLARPRLRPGIGALAAPLVAVALLRPAWVEMPIAPSRALSQLLLPAGARRLRTVHSPYGRVDVFRSPGVRFAPGLSLRYTGRLPEQVGLAVDGGSVTTATLAAGPEERAFVEHLPAALPFALRPGATALLVDPQGGLPWLIAQQFAAARVDCTASNPALARAVEELLGAARAPCGGRVAAGLGRNVLRGRPGRYDVVDLSLTGSLPVGTGGAGEDYALTVEAFEEYLAGLAPDGLLSVNIYLQPPYRAELRLFAVVLAALERSGAADPSRHVVAVRSLETLCLVVKRAPFTAAELDAVRGFAAERWFDPVWPPPIAPAADAAFVRTRGEDLAGRFAQLADPARRGAFVRGYLFDVAPATDERPFFHFSLRLERARETYELVQRRWDFFVHEGYLAPAVLLQVGALGLLMLAVPAALARGVPACGRWRAVAYFAALGAGYLCVEIALLQRLILALERPLTAASLVIGTILVGSGLGALAGQRVARPAPSAAALAVAATAGAAAALLGPLVSAIAALPPPARVPAAVALVLPLGFVMGLPFPWGIRVLHAAAPSLVPWAWAANGYFSVLAPLAAALLATRIGYSGVLAVGAAAYAAAALAGRRLSAAGPCRPAARR